MADRGNGELKRKRVASLYTVYCLLSVYQTLLVSKPSGAMGLDYDGGQVNVMEYGAKARDLPSVSVRAL
jgi:hypothetical protein